MPRPRVSKINADIESIKTSIDQMPQTLKEGIIDNSNRSTSELFLSLDNLPSKGKFYRNDLKIQPLKTMDVFILSNITNENYIYRYSDIFSRHIIGVDPLEILSIDEYYLLIWLRENAYPGYHYNSESYTCSNCQKPVPSTKFTHDKFSFDTNIDNVGGELNSIELDSGRSVSISVRRRYHDIIVEKFIDTNYKSIGQEIDNEEKKLLKFASVLSIDGVKDLEEKLFILKEEFSPLELIELLHKARGKTAQCKIYANVECPHCGSTNKAAFFFRTGIFLPTYQPTGINADAMEDI